MKRLNENTGFARNRLRIIRFVMIGGVNTAVGYLMYAGLVLVSFHPQLALAFSFSLGVLWNFWTHGRFVFGNSRISRLPKYGLCYVGIYLFNSVGLSYALGQSLNPLLAQAILAPIVAVLSYFLISWVLTGRFSASD